MSTLPLVQNINSLFCKKHANPTIFLTEKCFKSFKIFKICFFLQKKCEREKCFKSSCKTLENHDFPPKQCELSGRKFFFQKKVFHQLPLNLHENTTFSSKKSKFSLFHEKKCFTKKNCMKKAEKEPSGAKKLLSKCLQ